MTVKEGKSPYSEEKNLKQNMALQKNAENNRDFKCGHNTF